LIVVGDGDAQLVDEALKILQHDQTPDRSIGFLP
jgi:hypothetical protein